MTMNARRIRAGIAIGALGLICWTGTASALEGCDLSDCGGGGGGGGGGGNRHHSTPTTTTTALATVSSATATTTAPELAFTAEEDPAASGGTLPFTGGDVLELTAIGAGALAIGTVLIRRSRPRTTG